MRNAWAVVGDGALALTLADVGVDRAADDRAGTHDGDLHGQVFDVARLGARQHRDLRARFDLEDTDGVAAADVFVERLVGEG